MLASTVFGPLHECTASALDLRDNGRRIAVGDYVHATEREESRDTGRAVLLLVEGVEDRDGVLHLTTRLAGRQHSGYYLDDRCMS